jgi:hypothetical protein
MANSISAMVLFLKKLIIGLNEEEKLIDMTDNIMFITTFVFIILCASISLIGFGMMLAKMVLSTL